MTNNNESHSSLLAFVLGGLIGAAIGILLAPNSGEKTRESLLKNIENLKEKYTEKPKHTKR
jgi:gas vesicle protein